MTGPSRVVVTDPGVDLVQSLVMAQSANGRSDPEMRIAHTVNHKRATEASITLQKQLFPKVWIFYKFSQNRLDL